jgi:hypothetical protein
VSAADMDGLWHDGKLFDGAMDAGRYDAERTEQAEKAQAARIRGRELPIPTLEKSYSETEIDAIRMTASELAEKIRRDCADDLGHRHQVQAIRLHQFDEVRRRLDRLRASAGHMRGDVHNNLPAT